MSITPLTIPTVTVDGPAVEQHPYGLFTALAWRPNGGTRWVAGGVQLPRLAQSLTDPFDVDTEWGSECGQVLAYLAGPTDGGEVFYPLAIRAESPTCLTIGATEDDRDAAATALLATGGQTVAEAALWSAATATNPGSLPDRATPVTPSAVSLVAGVAALEADPPLGHRGVLHVSKTLGTYLAAAGLIKPSANNGTGTMYTLLGTPVVVGYGYDGTVGPAGSDAAATGTEWAYMTSSLFGYRSEAELQRTFDTGTNDAVTTAYQELLIGWAGTPRAALVTLA